MKTLPSYRSWLGRPLRRAKRRASSDLALLGKIRSHSDRLKTETTKNLARELDALRQKVRAGQRVTSLSIAIPAFALTTEAVRRATGKTYYDVQIHGGLVLSAGGVAEIQTGEGKTIVAALPAVVRALEGRGVHVATTNEYLSQRDFEQLAPAYRMLGLSVGLVRTGHSSADRCRAYGCDITYAPGYEFAFDFLRDQLVLRNQRQRNLGSRYLRKLQGESDTPGERIPVQRELGFAIVDEADSVLVDEAVTPLIVGGANPAARTDPEVYAFAGSVAASLLEGRDYLLDPAAPSITFTTDGWLAIRNAFHQCPRGRLATSSSHLVENALRAERLLHRDQDYVVRNGQVVLVDQNTGRLHEERKWRAGLHQAVEVKEQLPPTQEQQTEASITRQRFSRQYAGMCGMTGTAQGAARDFREFYGLPVVAIPPNRACIRTRLATKYFPTAASKYRAIAADVRALIADGRPVLIGTQSIKESRAASSALAAAGVSHTVLNGVQDADEASIVAAAGASGSVTVATNMAGRGTDIRLDARARAAGGLHAVAAEFHTVRRTDLQLAGRAARQGDPGSVQHLASAEDAVLKEHSPDLTQRIGRAARHGGSTNSGWDVEVERLQARMEREGHQARRLMVAHDHWLESVRSSLTKRA